VQEHPESAETSFWLAKICAKDTPERAIALYRKGLALDPDNGRRWRELGDLLVKHDLQAALHAYSQSCQNGDPGANGCWLAGQTAERRGDLKMAISFYRLSRWSVALNRAAQLEREIGRPRHDD
jgi:Tfp pilus assembly protein PilF